MGGIFRVFGSLLGLDVISKSVEETEDSIELSGGLEFKTQHVEKVLSEGGLLKLKGRARKNMISMKIINTKFIQTPIFLNKFFIGQA